MINGQLVPTAKVAKATNLTASALVKTGAGAVAGVVINSFTATASMKLWDNTSAATTVLFNTITFNTNERTIDFFGAKFGVGLFVTITGTADITIMYND